ncbi:spermine/spermidine synthase domain-containing protein [Modestobacter sp. SYSU DS0657]
MSKRLEELAWSSTPIGELSLRRRRDPVTGSDVFEIKLGDEFLMSSLFTVAEVEVARLALARLDGDRLDVAVGGLGLGYTAETVLADPRVQDLVVVDLLEPVIDWHRQGLLPVGHLVAEDPRCRLVQGDFFAMVAGDGLDPATPGRTFDAVVVDIDHSPRHLLDEDNAPFYRPAGMARLSALLRPNGVFSLWSNDPPDEEYLAALSAVFADVEAQVIDFPNPLQERVATNTVYLATARD